MITLDAGLRTADEISDGNRQKKGFQTMAYNMASGIETADRRRRRALRAFTPLAAILVAALLIWQGSNAAFSASTYNTDDTWETGNLLLTNNGGNGTYSGTTAALFNELNLKPGDTGAKCITVESTGSLPGSLRMFRGPISGTNNFAALAAWIDLTVDAQAVGATTNVNADCVGYTGGTGGAVFAGTLDGVPDTYAGAAGTAMAGGPERVVYRIGWTIDTNADNSVQNSSAVADLTWEIN
jgi:hypothetical protein